MSGLVALLIVDAVEEGSLFALEGGALPSAGACFFVAVALTAAFTLFGVPLFPIVVISALLQNYLIQLKPIFQGCFWFVDLRDPFVPIAHQDL